MSVKLGTGRRRGTGLVDISSTGLGQIRVNVWKLKETTQVAIVRAATRLSAFAPGFVEQQITGGKLVLPGPLPEVAKRRKNGSLLSLFDTGRYARSWTAQLQVGYSKAEGRTSKVGRYKTSISVHVTPQGATTEGLPFATLAKFLDQGTIKTRPFPHINRLTERLYRVFFAYVREEVARGISRNT